MFALSEPRTGALPADAARMADLVELAVEFAVGRLRPHGALVAKAFHGSGYGQLVRLFKDRFREVKSIKPKASRSRSSRVSPKCSIRLSPCLT